jgi:hypothetical protein
MNKLYLTIGILIAIALFALIVLMPEPTGTRFPRGETIGGEFKCFGGECPINLEPLPENFSFSLENETH